MEKSNPVKCPWCKKPMEELATIYPYPSDALHPEDVLYCRACDKCSNETCCPRPVTPPTSKSVTVKVWDA